MREFLKVIPDQIVYLLGGYDFYVAIGEANDIAVRAVGFGGGGSNSGPPEDGLPGETTGDFKVSMDFIN